MLVSIAIRCPCFTHFSTLHYHNRNLSLIVQWSLGCQFYKEGPIYFHVPNTSG